MKKIISCIITSAIAIGNFVVKPVKAEETLVYNNFEYAVVNDEMVLLTGCADKSVESVDIPAQIDGRNVNVTNGIFSDCSKLNEINVDEKNIYIYDIDGVLFSDEDNSLIDYPRGRTGEYTIPENTTVIGESAFENAKWLTYVNIPDSLTGIEPNAFKNCTSLTGFSAPIPLGQSGDSIYGCTALKKLELAVVSEPTAIANLKFENCPDLESVVIPDNYVLGGAFNLTNCPQLKEIVLPQYAHELMINISNCVSLTSFAMPECKDIDLTNFSHVAISNCSAMTELKLSNAQRITVENMSALKTIKLNAYPHSSSDDIYNDIDYATCPELKDIYLYNIDVQPTPQESMLMAQNNILVHCRKNESWSDYLTYYNVRFVYIDDEIVYGDVNIDGYINMADAVLIMQSLSNPDKYQLTESQRARGDVFNNDGITNMDALTIQNYLVGIVESLPV